MTRLREELRRGIDPDDALDAVPVEGEIEARADADLQYPTSGAGDYATAVGRESLVAHREMHEARKDLARVVAHGES